jgi:type VI secretion system secreted protein VgrG
MPEVSTNVVVQLPDAPLAGLSVRRFVIEEAMSAPFRIRLSAVSPDTSLDFGSLVGHPAVVTMSGRAVRTWRGICVSAELSRVAEAGASLGTYEVVIVPELHRLTQRRNNRLFQHVTARQIADTLLDEWGIARTWRITDAEHPRLELRTQYDETDFDFLSRILEEAGISFWFAEEAGEGALVLGDAPHTAAPRPAPIAFVDDTTTLKPGFDEYVTDVRVRETTQPGRVTLRDHDVRQPRFPAFARADSSRTEDLPLEHYHHAPGAFRAEGAPQGALQTPVADDRGVSRTREARGQWLARRMVEAHDAARTTVELSTDVNDLSPASVFRIAHHPHEQVGVTKALLVTRLHMEGENVVGDWKMRVTAVPAARPYRPARVTPRPRIGSLLTAVVVGPGEAASAAGLVAAASSARGAVGSVHPAAVSADGAAKHLVDNEIYVDELGRVRVQFPWDREHAFSAESSIWMRVSQGWAGSGYGLFTVPRVGHEVLVAFVDGDPDNPIIVGRVHNGAEPVPFPLPANKTVSTWKTASSPGGGGFNELRFDDAAGREHVYLQAQKDMDHLVKNDLKQAVGHDATRYVQGNDSAAVGGNRTTFVSRNEVDATGLNRASSVGLNRTANIGVEDTTLVGTRWSVAVARGMTRKLTRELESMANGVGGILKSAAGSVIGLIPSSPLAAAADAALSSFGQSAFERIRTTLSAVDGFAADPGPPPTSIEMVDRQIRLSTGEASIVLDGPNVSITAQGAIALHAAGGITILGEDEVAVAGRQKVALVSATSDVILQARKNVHLNPFEPGAPLAEAARRGAEAGRDPTPPGVCEHCGLPMSPLPDGTMGCLDTYQRAASIALEGTVEMFADMGPDPVPEGHLDEAPPDGAESA